MDAASLAEPLEFAAIANLVQLGIAAENLTVPRVALDGDRVLALLHEGSEGRSSEMRLLDIRAMRCGGSIECSLLPNGILISFAAS